MSEIKVIDLFCGAGGITCGFEGLATPLVFKTVLGLDVDQSAINIYNQNFDTSASDAKVKIGRKVDLTWFAHPVEIRLFYLVHLFFSGTDKALKPHIETLRVNEFLSRLDHCDRYFASLFAELAGGADYKAAMSSSLTGTGATALVKALVTKLGLTSLASPRPASAKLPWCEEYQHIPERTFQTHFETDAEICASLRDFWSTQVQGLVEASQKAGRGKLKGNAAKVADVANFLLSDQGSALGQLWVSWRAARDTIRATFCVSHGNEIDALYSGERRVQVVLGGPPCKGFSRIGRPVIQSLRDQGVHAWSHREYGDERNALMCQYVLFLEALQPDVFLFENVANFQSALRTPNGVLDAPTLLVELIDAISDSAHYAVKHRVLNARQFGVPQDRRRFIMLGVKRRIRNVEKVLTEFFNFDSAADDVALAVALDGLSTAVPFDTASRDDGEVPVYQKLDERMPPAELKYRRWIYASNPITGEDARTTTAHVYRSGRDDDRAFIEYVAPGIRWMDLKPSKSPTLKQIATILESLERNLSSKKDITDLTWLKSVMDDSLVLRLILEHNQVSEGLKEQHLLLEGYLQNGSSMHGDWFERLSATKPSKTVVAHIGKDTYGYWHPYESRSITIREAARIQSFPDWFRISNVGVVDAYTAIGNAVPPLMAKAFADRLRSLNSKYPIFASTLEVGKLQAAE